MINTCLWNNIFHKFHPNINDKFQTVITLPADFASIVKTQYSPR